MLFKSNNLIEARYRLSLQESQVVLWLLTQIGPDDEDFKMHKLEIAKFAQFTKTNVEGKYEELRDITKRLMQRVMEIYDPYTKDLLQVNWLSSAYYKSKQGYVFLEFSPNLKPYLLQLKSQFTKISITDTLKLKSIYAIRILELLIQYESIGKRRMNLEDIRLWCGIEKDKYRLYAHLKTKVIDNAKTEINSKTNYEIEYLEIKESRKVVAIEWRIKKKNSEEEELKNKIKALENELNYRFVLIKDLMDYGYSKSLATKIVKENDEMVIKNALSVVSLQIRSGNVKNPGTMLRVAIAEKWHPERYKASSKSEGFKQYFADSHISMDNDDV